MKHSLLGLVLFLPLWTIAAGGGAEKQRPYLPQGGNYTEAESFEAAAVETISRGETIFRAFAKAYPDRTDKVEFIDGDWTIRVYGQTFYFAEGRLLPASLRGRYSEFAPHPFYNYSRELPPWIPLTEEESARMREQESRRGTGTSSTGRSSHFFDALWRTRNRDEAWEHVKQIRLFGNPVQIHNSILVHLSLVEETILRAANSNNAVRQWVNSITTVEGWNWRNIASSQSRSYHAYGAAVDLLPKSLGGLETYWLWTARHTPEWWTVPYSKRFHPPIEVIKIFESFGFVWGGKWRFYDTMHFEYRPEIMVLSGIPLIDFRDLR